MQLYYTNSASCWEETLPIGNGSLGAMIWGNTKEEHLGLNQDSLWSGYPHDKNNHHAFEYLKKARQLVENRKYTDAEALIQNHMLAEYNESYLPLGDLFFRFHTVGEITNYKRVLDIEEAIANVSYCQNGHQYKREYFASYPANAIFIKFTCDSKELHFHLAFQSEIKHSQVVSKQGISINGQCPEHLDPIYVHQEPPIVQGTRGMAFSAGVQILSCDGQVSIQENQLQITDASSTVLAIWAVKASSYDVTAGFDAWKEAHITDYQSIYKKVDFYLGEQSSLPTNVRLQNLREGVKDNSLYALYFQYGRYLLISSSREGSLPANLQGIWSWQFRAPWCCNFTTNINLQMNYWPAQSCNLTECISPYIEFIKKLVKEGQKTAHIHYGCRGFVHHHNADYWGNTNPAGYAHGHDKGEGISATWGFWPMGGAWLVDEIYRHYEYNPDENYLRDTVYPILKEASLFLVDWLYEYNGIYVSCPSTSPENRFLTEDGDCCIAMNTAMDLTLIREVFHHFQKTCEILGITDELLPDIQIRLEKLAPLTIGSYGQILEWNEEFEEKEPGQRHLSHLYGLFPSEEFENDEQLKDACRIALQHRMENGSGHTGWSCAWIINLLAILGEGEKAITYLNKLLCNATHSNLWGDHPPFQIDANFGATAAIANMLVQNRKGTLKILPALPTEWSDGYIKGLRLKEGRSIDIYWKESKLTDYKIYE